MLAILTISSALAGDFWEGDEADALEHSSLAIIGEVTEASCLSSAFIDEEGSYEEIYQTTVVVDQILESKLEGFNETSVTVISRVKHWAPENEPDCENNFLIHPVGEKGTYYLNQMNSDGDLAFTLYLGQAFIESEDSDPQLDPECPSLDPEEQDPTQDSEEAETIEDNEKLGCSSSTSSPTYNLSWMMMLLGISIARRQTMQ